MRAIVLAVLLFLPLVPTASSLDACVADPRIPAAACGSVEATERGITISTSHVEYETSRSASSCGANVTAADMDADGRCAAARCEWKEGADGRRAWVCTEHSTAGCALDIGNGSSDPNAGCGDELAAATQGYPFDPDVRERCAASIAIDEPGVYRCRSTGDLDGDGDPDFDLACAGDAGCAIVSKWRVYAPLPNAFSAGSCGAATASPSAWCTWDGAAGWGAVGHDGLPPAHSNVVIADFDRDGALDVVVVERGGRVYAWTQATGPVGL